MESVDLALGPDRFTLRAGRSISEAEIARSVDSVVVARGLRGALDRLGAVLGLRREPACPT